MEDTNTIPLKLLIDTKANKVVFAEASKDFVDFLFCLLSLPIGTAMKLLAGKSLPGSMVRIYNSFANLDKAYLQPNLQKDILLNAEPSIPFPKLPLLTSTAGTTPGKVYTCLTPNCKTAVTDKYKGSRCPHCLEHMTEEIKFIPGASGGSSSDRTAPEGYVQQVATYMISDDLTVTPMSTISSISMMNKFLRVKEVKVGNEEGLKLLQFSFQSTSSVLTNVFLRKTEKRKASVQITTHKNVQEKLVERFGAKYTRGP